MPIGISFWLETVERIKEFALIKDITIFWLGWHLKDKTGICLTTQDYLIANAPTLAPDFPPDKVTTQIVYLANENGDLSFACIVVNNTAQAIKFPAFFTADNGVKIKFPDGKIYAHPNSGKTEKLTIAPGQCRYVIFDLGELLKNDSEFSLKNFDFGLSELQWELRKPSGEIKREIFHLIKFNGELPPDNGEGYHLLVPPTPATFRDKLIKVLPPEVIE